MLVPRFSSALAAVVAMTVLVVVRSREAHAQAPTSQVTEYSPYERETIRRVLAETGLQLDTAPDGKIIEHIDTVRLDVLESRDPIPDKFLGIPVRKVLNSLHYTSRDYVIRREMLLREGDVYQRILADETARNMRTRMPFQVSIVLIVPVRAHDPKKVSLLVVTKDIWSLRLSYDIAVTRGGVERFVLVPQETNLFGRHHTASATFQYLPESYSFGVGYQVPRFGTSWIGGQASANIIFNRRSWSPEGSGMAVRTGQDLYSTKTTWGWNANASYTTSIVRRYVNAELATFDSPRTPQQDGIPTAYRSENVNASVGVARSFGWGLKNNVGLTFNVSQNAYRTGDLSAFAPEAVSDFVQRFIPVGETRVYPALSWTTFQNDYLRTLDVMTLALQEDYRLGHEISASIYPVTRALGSTRTLLGFTARAGYTVAMGDGLASLRVQTIAEEQDGTITDGSVGGTFLAVSPRFKIGRLLTNISVLDRYRNYLRARTYAGGDDRLRGYPTNYFVGKDAVFYNIEFRSTSVEIGKCQLGGVLFYDVGDVADGFDKLSAKQSIGTGLRLLIPQLNRVVFRADLAIPLDRGPFPETGISTPVNPVGFFLGFSQAFEATPVDLTTSTSGSVMRPPSPVSSFYGLSQ